MPASADCAGTPEGDHDQRAAVLGLPGAAGGALVRHVEQGPHRGDAVAGRGVAAAMSPRGDSPVVPDRTPRRSDAPDGVLDSPIGNVRPVAPFSSDVTPRSAIPHGTISSKCSRSVLHVEREAVTRDPARDAGRRSRRSSRSPTHAPVSPAMRPASRRSRRRRGSSPPRGRARSDARRSDPAAGRGSDSRRSGRGRDR